jgi:acetyltransferase-like isoleucine patch superfamily enzyme
MTTKWKKPMIKHSKLTKYNYIIQYPKNLKLGKNFDIGTFTYINSRHGVTIEDYVQIGSHCAIYSDSTIDNQRGSVVLKQNCKVGTHSTIMPNVTIGKNSIIGAYSFVKHDVPDNELWVGIPAKFMRKVSKLEQHNYRKF